MALIKCSECGKEISDKATLCPNCGAPVNPKTKVTIIGYTGYFAVYPEVDIYANDVRVGIVHHGETVTIEISEDTVFTFNLQGRKTNMAAKYGKDQTISLQVDRMMGGLKAQNSLNPSAVSGSGCSVILLPFIGVISSMLVYCFL